VNILVDSGDYKCSNIGDVAMLQVAVSRLREHFSEARIQVITSNPDYLCRFISTAEAVPFDGLRDWLSDRYVLGRAHAWVPAAVRVASAMRRRAPKTFESLVRVRARSGSGTNLNRFLEAVHNADLIVVCGQGGINDEFRGHALTVLNFLDFVMQLGKPVIMLGQGLGPIRDANLLSRARSVLPRVDLIALREGRASLALLRSLGVADERVMITGDDAVELAHSRRGAELGNGLGVNVRAAAHNGITQSEIEGLRGVIHSLSKKLGAPLLPIPISRYPELKDARDIELLFRGFDDSTDCGRDLETPSQVISQVARCRVVATAAYHAAVFALSQGIPVVCLARSQYVTEKFLGLRELFGPGCEVVWLQPKGAANAVGAAIEKAWHVSDATRDELRQCGMKQIEAANLAWKRIAGQFARLETPVW
jgi:polysaccharide pyruvyl transferase WcaK-like protein